MFKSYSLAGKLRFPATVEEVTETKNSYGESTVSWSTRSHTRASIRPLNGREYFDQAKAESEVSHKVVIRYEDGITTKMRINYSNRIFDIQSILNVDERNRQLTLMCLESVD